MGEKFHFVDGIGADRASKRLMRSHVMKGKNAGKTLHRRTRPGARRQRSEVITKCRESEIAECQLASPVDTSLMLGSLLRTLSTPVDFTRYSLGVIHKFFCYVVERMYPLQLGLTLEDSKYLWLQMLVTDEAAHHCCIALLQACNHIFFLNGDSSPEALYHVSQAYALIKKRLSSPEALSDSTIWLVISFIHQEQIKTDRSKAKIHVDGMRRMIELRGGLEQLEGNLPLTLKICKTDIVFTLQYGGSPSFYRDNMSEVREALLLQGYELLPDISAASVQHLRLDPRLHGIFLDSLRVSYFFNKHAKEHGASLVAFQEMAISLLSRLLRFQPIGAVRRGTTLEAAYHAGLVTFMMTLCLQYQKYRVVDCKLTFQLLREVLDTEVVDDEGELALWIMVVGGMWIWEYPGEEWLAPRLRDISRKMDIESWDGARCVLKKFPWVDCMHDDAGRHVWERACTNTKT